VCIELFNERRHVQAGSGSARGSAETGCLHHQALRCALRRDEQSACLSRRNPKGGAGWCRRPACTMKRLTRAFLVLALLLLSEAATSFAAPALLEVTVSATSPRIGDRVLVRVAARGGEDLMWGELKVGIEAEGPWALVDGPREMAGARPPVWELVLAPMAVGELSLPDLRWRGG